MTTLLAEHHRKARKAHLCELCLRKIEPKANYLEQRLADDGTVFSFRAHHDCHSAFWSWFSQYDEPEGMLIEASEGHLPPCPHAWADANHDAVCRCVPDVLSGQADIFGGVA